MYSRDDLPPDSHTHAPPYDARDVNISRCEHPLGVLEPCSSTSNERQMYMDWKCQLERHTSGYWEQCGQVPLAGQGRQLPANGDDIYSRGGKAMRTREHGVRLLPSLQGNSTACVCNEDL